MIPNQGMSGALSSSFKPYSNVSPFDSKTTQASGKAKCTAHFPNGHGLSGLQISCPHDLGALDKQHIGSILQNGLSLRQGRSLHTYIIQVGFDADIFLMNHLVTMYGKCGALQEAFSVFDNIALPNIVSWNVLISVYAHHGYRDHTLQLFKQLQENGFEPNKITFLSLLRVCNNPVALLDGKHIHLCIINYGLDADPTLGGALVTMYGRCETLEEAWLVFLKSGFEDIAPWNAIISLFSQKGMRQNVLSFFGLVLERGIEPDRAIFTSSLHVCDDEEDFEDGMVIHTCIIESGLDSDCIVGTALSSMYGRCGALNEACAVFNGMQHHDVVSWTALISAYAQQEYCEDALGCFEQMVAEGVKPNELTFMSVLHACSSLMALEQSEMLYSYVVESGFEHNCLVGTALVNMYISCGALEVARLVFDGMYNRDVAAWTIMIDAYNEIGNAREALDLFWQLQQGQGKLDEFVCIGALNACANLRSLTEGGCVHQCVIDCGFQSNYFVQTALVKMYGDCEALDKAKLVFDELHPRDLIAWNAMLSVYAKRGFYNDSLSLFQHMIIEGTQPNASSFLSVLGACAGLAALSEGTLLHADVVECGLELDVLVGNALINMYGKCGTLEDACFLFEKMSCRTVMTWTSMMAAYAQQGQVKMVITVFQSMLNNGIKPDEIAFVSVLSACSHGGFIEDGIRFFVSIREEHGITPTVDHYRCIVDLFGRPGLLKEAESFISKMPLEPDSPSWLSLLSACKKHGDIGCGKWAAKQAIGMNSVYSAPYVLLSDIWTRDEGAVEEENLTDLVGNVS